MKRTLFILWRIAEFISRFFAKMFQNTAAYCICKLQEYPELIRPCHQQAVIGTANKHNMALHPDEDYYRHQYWHWIQEALSSIPLEKEGALFLDLGCGQGRLTRDLARWTAAFGGRVIGIDVSKHVVEYAREVTVAEGLLTNVEYVQEDLLTYLEKTPSSSCTMLLCTEVLYMVPEYKDVLHEMRRILAPGGVVVAGFRSRYFNILHSIKNKCWDALPLLIKKSEGYIWGPITRFSWFSTDEIRKLLSDEGFVAEDFWGIGTCSGIEGDPLASVAQPSRLNTEEQAKLLEVELQLSVIMPNCGRYILVKAVKA